MPNRFLNGLLILCYPIVSFAQCAMCRAVAENTRPETAEALNNGIIFLMVVPYVLFFLVGYLLYRYFKKQV